MLIFLKYLFITIKYQGDSQDMKNKSVISRSLESSREINNYNEMWNTTLDVVFVNAKNSIRKKKSQPQGEELTVMLNFIEGGGIHQ